MLGLLIAMLLDGPRVKITNRTATRVTVSIETDIPETYPSVSLGPDTSRSIRVSGQDQAIRALARLLDGRVLRSDEIYVTSGIDVTVEVTQEGMNIGYAFDR